MSFIIGLAAGVIGTAVMAHLKPEMFANIEAIVAKGIDQPKPPEDTNKK